MPRGANCGGCKSMGYFCTQRGAIRLRRRIWKKEDPPVNSGLSGPVRLFFAGKRRCRSSSATGLT